MKRAISILIVLTICATLFGCGGSGNSKYIGTYESDYTAGDNAIQYTASIELLPGGKGTYTSIATKVDESKCTIFIKEGREVQAGTVTWEVSDGYLVLHVSITTNLTTKLFGKWSTTTKEPESYTETYELKGSKLINVDHDWDTWDKTK